MRDYIRRFTYNGDHCLIQILWSILWFKIALTVYIYILLVNHKLYHEYTPGLPPPPKKKSIQNKEFFVPDVTMVGLLIFPPGKSV